MDINLDRKLDKKEIKKLLRLMNYEISGHYFKALFAKFDKDKSGSIEFEEFIELMNHMRDRAELEVFFCGYRDPETNLITAKCLMDFLF